MPVQPDRMVRDHMERTASIKHTFTPEDMYARAQATLEQRPLHGVTHMRTQVEVDPNVGLLGFEVVEQLRKDYPGRSISSRASFCSKGGRTCPAPTRIWLPAWIVVRRW